MVKVSNKQIIETYLKFGSRELCYKLSYLKSSDQFENVEIGKLVIGANSKILELQELIEKKISEF